MKKQRTLRTKLLTSFGLIILLLMIVIAIYYYTVHRSTESFEHLLEHEVAIATHARNINAFMLQSRRNEKDFLLRRDTNYVETHTENMAALTQETQTILRLVEEEIDETQSKAIADNASEILEYARSYSDKFAALVAAWEKRGLDHNSGLQGEFRAIVHDLEDEIARFEIEDLYLTFLQLRHDEQEFLRRKTSAAQQQFFASLEAYQEQLETSSCDPEAKEVQQQAFTTYREQLDEYLSRSPEFQAQYPAHMQIALDQIEKSLKQVYVPEIRALLLQIRRREKDYLLRLDQEYVEATHQAVQEALDAFQNANVLPKHLTMAEEHLSAYTRKFDDLVAEDQNIANLTATMRETVHQIEPAVEKIVTQVEEMVAEKTAATIVEANFASNIALGIGAAAIVIGVLFSLLIMRGILRQLGADPTVVAAIARQVATGDLEIAFDTHSAKIRGLLADMQRMVVNLRSTVQVAEQIAGGDLTVTVTPLSDKDVLGYSLVTMIEKLREIVSDIQNTAENVAASSSELSSSAEEMSQGATEQASSAEEASSSMEEMAANIKQNADNAVQTEKIAVQASSDADQSGSAVTETVLAMREIAGKISIIEEISRQTHMLSLNATIEAAKAQEYGKGFAVVASEVRALAERSRTSAEEINSLASSSLKTAEKAGEMLTRLVPDIEKTAALVQEITAACHEQNSGASQINDAIQQLDQVIQKNASMSEEMAATAEELSSQAELLQHTMSFFRVQQGGREKIPSRTTETYTAPQTPKRRHTDKSDPKNQGASKDPGPALKMNHEVPGSDETDDDFERY